MMDNLPAGTLVDDRYCVTKLLGKGGMGSVYAATDVALNRTVALKVILAEHAASPDFKLRFKPQASPHFFSDSAA